MRTFPGKLKRWHKSLLYLVLAIIIVGLFTSALLYSHFFGPVDRYAGQVQFVVQPDETTDQISDTLKSEGFIRSRTIFDMVYSAEGHGRTTIPGGYNLSADMDVWSIAGALLQPPPMVFFSFPPGWRKEQIADKLVQALDWTPAQKAEWLNVDTAPSPSFVEGVYYPDTYLIPSGATPAQVANMFITRFQEQFAPYADQAEQEGIPWTEVVTLASILEREAAGAQDMPLIAGIMLNRLNLGMALQIDATLQYIKGTEGDWWPVPTAADKSLQSPFNTYLHAGLPPHAISEPGLGAIKSVLDPEKTNCLYYLHDDNGQIHCSATYSGQLANVNKYLK
jgi:UPF0755 protein